MNQALHYAPLNSSRLVRFLSDLHVCAADYSTKDFGMRLSALIDFSDSIVLSTAHRNLSDVVFDQNSTTAETSQQAFLNVRALLVESIVKSTTPNGTSVGTADARIKPPPLQPHKEASATDVLDFEPYHRFYAAHQRDMTARLKPLRSHLREALSGYSPELARLAELDTALDETLLAQTRKFFSVIPKLLNRHFDDLVPYHNVGESHKVVQGYDDPVQWIQKGAWLERFYNNMQTLLLAELEVRLQPLLGLLEALMEASDKEVNRVHD